MNSACKPYLTEPTHLAAPRCEVVDSGFVFDADPRFSSCHAATIAEAAGGRLLAAWFGGSQEGADDVGIWLSRRELGAGWSVPECLAAEPGLPHWNPVLFSPRGTPLPLL
jgi:predicted neuraminidase